MRNKKYKQRKMLSINQGLEVEGYSRQAVKPVTTIS